MPVTLVRSSTENVSSHLCTLLTRENWEKLQINISLQARRDWPLTTPLEIVRWSKLDTFWWLRLYVFRWYCIWTLCPSFRSFCSSSSEGTFVQELELWTYLKERYSPCSTNSVNDTLKVWMWVAISVPQYCRCTSSQSPSWPPAPLKILTRQTNEQLLHLMPSERGCKGFRILIQRFIDVTRGQRVEAYPFGIYNWNLKGYHRPDSLQLVSFDTMSQFPVEHLLLCLCQQSHLTS